MSDRMPIAEVLIGALGLALWVFFMVAAVKLTWALIETDFTKDCAAEARAEGGR